MGRASTFTFLVGEVERVVRRLLVGVVCLWLLVGGVGCAAVRVDDQALTMEACVTTGDLRRRFGNPKNHQGITYNQAVGVSFQDAVLKHLPGGRYVRANTSTFRSEVRADRTGKRFLGVIPDGVAGAVEGSPYPFGPIITTHPESTFIEVKAVNGAITPGYANWQTIGLLDALSKSPAASDRGKNRAYPSLYFVTTRDTSVTQEVMDIASVMKILVWISCVADVQGDLVALPPKCLNCGSVFDDSSQSQGVQVGPLFSFPDLGGPGMGGLDEPILDDGLVGYPGTRGRTEPNP